MEDKLGEVQIDHVKCRSQQSGRIVEKVEERKDHTVRGYKLFN